MDNVANFYNNILAIEITTLGIIATGIFVILQMLHSNFSYKDMLLPLKQVFLLAYVILSIPVVLFTGLGSLHFAMGAHDLIPYFNLNLSTIFESDYTTSTIFIIFLLSIFLGVKAIFEIIKLLNPTFLMRKHLEMVDNKAVEKFLYNRYGVPKPFPPISILYTFIGETETTQAKIEKDTKIKNEEKIFIDGNKKYEDLKTFCKNAPDVFEEFENLLIKAISQGERGVVTKAISDFKFKIINTIERSDESFPFRHLSTYSGESLNMFLESCRKNDAISFAPQFVRMSREIMVAFVCSVHSEDAREMLKEWKEQGDLAIKNSNRLLFREIIQGYQEIADIAFEKEGPTKQGRNDILDNVFRDLSWLTTRLLTQKGIEERYSMNDDNHDDEFSALYNALFHFEGKYNHDKPDAYPLIFFDAIYILFEQLLRIYTAPQKEEKISNNKGYIEDWLYSCAYAYYSFSSEAIKVCNGNGIAIAGMKLKYIYEKTVDTNAEKVAQNIIELIVQLAILTATNKEKLIGDAFLTGNIVSNLETIILNSRHTEAIRRASYESYWNFHDGDHTKKGDYIRDLENKTGISII